MTDLRRLVTVVFADVVGSTALAEELDAEDVRALLTRYYAAAHEVVGAHGGVVAKLLGDGVLACFGIPTAHGDDAQRALDAALSLRARVAADPALERLRLRIGVNTGEVLASEDASGEIVGDAVNVAARVAAAAGEDEILAAESAHRAAPRIEYGEVREFAAKGKSRPVRVWPVRGRAGARAGSAAPFIGREDDLAQLELAARRAFRDRRPYLATITAPPGTGKSRLVQEFRSRLGTEVRCAYAHCPPYGQMLALGPLRELLLGLLGLSEGAPPEDVRLRIAEVLGGPEATRDAQLIALTVAPEGGPGEQERDAVFAAWRGLLLRLAAERSLLVVLEDIHNASDSLLDLVEQIAQPGVEAPLLVVCLARPDLLERRVSWGGGRRNSLNLALEPLSDDDIAALVSGLLETEPRPVLRDRLVERAAGNPFFAEELVRALLERGPLDLGDDAAIGGALAALPETVQATVLARIDMLPPEERAVLQSAAVVGLTFDTAALRVVCEIDDAAVDRALPALAERELISRSGDGSFAFRHALVRDVAYGMLPRARRARDHALVARRLEGSAGERADELAMLIGLHYLEATKLRRASAVPTGGDADDERTRAAAVSWIARGARVTAAAGAWAEAIRQLEQGLTVAASSQERAELLVRIGEIAVGGDTGWDALDEALRLWRTLPDASPGLGARIILAELLLLFRSGVSVLPGKLPDTRAQERLAAEALALARRSGEERLLATALYTHAYLERTRADRTPASLASARDEARDAAALLERCGEWTRWSHALDVWAAIESDLGDLRRGYELAKARVDRADSVAPTERAHVYWTMPIYEMALGRVTSALSHVQQGYSEPALVNSRWAYGTTVGQVFLLGWRGGVHWALGRWEDVVADVREALEPFAGLPATSMRSVFSHAAAAGLYVARRREDRELLDLVVPLVRGWCDDERVLALLEDDPSRLDGALDRVTSASIDTWMVERSLSVLNAYGRAPGRSLDEPVRYAESHGLLPLLAQLLRLRARATRSAEDARRARAILAECGMSADAALAAVELAALGDRSSLASAREELARVGDARGLAAADALG